MVEEHVLDTLDKTIAMVSFMTSAVQAIIEQPHRSLAEIEVFGMQQVYFHIEEQMKGVKSCVEQMVSVPESKKSEVGEIINFGQPPRTFQEVCPGPAAPR